MRVLIYGDIASGKTTLARELSQKYGYPVLHLNDIFYDELGGFSEWRREPKKFAEKYEKLVRIKIQGRHNLIIEGNQEVGLGEISKLMDIAIVLHPSKLTRLTRAIKRFITRDEPIRIIGLMYQLKGILFNLHDYDYYYHELERSNIPVIALKTWEERYVDELKFYGKTNTC